MNRGNIKNCFVLVALAFVMVAGGEVWENRAASAAAKPIKLRIMMPGEPGGAGFLGGMHGAAGKAMPVVYNVLEPLVDLGKKGEPVPKLATRWEHSADLTKWRFYLRRGVKFHNGANFTARDVVEFSKWSIDEGAASFISPFVPLKEAVAVDDYTVDLIFATPQPLHLILGRVFLIPPIALSRDNRAQYPNHPIGTGPYRFVEWKKGQFIKLAKFEGYWGPKPQIDEVEITFREEESVRMAALQAGEVDWIAALSPEAAITAPKLARIPGADTIYIRFDEAIQKETTGKDPLFSDKRLRLAVDYAMDRKALVALYRGFATPSLGQFASPGDFGFNPGLKSRPYDLEKAKALVKEADALGKSVTLVGVVGRWSKDREAAEAVAYMIEQTGLKVKPMLMPYSEVSKYWITQGENRKYMSDLHINASDTPLEAESRYSKLFAEGGVNYSLNDPEPTRLFAEEQAERDYAKRGEKLAKAWAYLYEQAHYIPLFKLEWTWGMAKNLEWDVGLTGTPYISDMKFTK